MEKKVLENIEKLFESIQKIKGVSVDFNQKLRLKKTSSDFKNVTFITGDHFEGLSNEEKIRRNYFEVEGGIKKLVQNFRRKTRKKGFRCKAVQIVEI